MDRAGWGGFRAWLVTSPQLLRERRLTRGTSKIESQNHLDLSKRDVSIITRNNERRKFDSDSS